MSSRRNLKFQKELPSPLSERIWHHEPMVDYQTLFRDVENLIIPDEYLHSYGISPPNSTSGAPGVFLRSQVPMHNHYRSTMLHQFPSPKKLFVAKRVECTHGGYYYDERSRYGVYDYTGAAQVEKKLILVEEPETEWPEKNEEKARTITTGLEWLRENLTVERIQKDCTDWEEANYGQWGSWDKEWKSPEFVKVVLLRGAEESLDGGVEDGDAVEQMGDYGFPRFEDRI